jgi:hypothetical protein
VVIPPEVIIAFDLLLSGMSYNQVADRFETSYRSIGRWMEKWNFNSYKAAAEAKSAPNPEADEIDKEDLEAAAEMAPAIIDNLAQKESPVNDENFAALVQSSKAPKPVTKVEQMRKLYNGWVLGGFKETDLNMIKLFKSASKKSWKVLGLTFAEENKIKDAE